MTQRFLKSSEDVCRAKRNQSQSTVSPDPIFGASARRNQRECVRALFPRRITIEAQLAAIKRAPQLVRSLFKAPSVAYITDW